MTVLVDTSAWYALLDEDDANHRPAAATWSALLDDEPLATHAYVVVETSALVQRRLGMGAIDRLHGHLLPAVEMWTVDDAAHRQAVARWRGAGRRNLSLVDVTSFVMMEQSGVDQAFAYDPDFTHAGFHTHG